MLGAGMDLKGADIALISNLPVGAGLSSSAALEIGIARALSAVADLEWDPKTAAMLSLRAEREFAGVDCGIMDQLVVACAREDHALLIDCRSLETRDVRLPDGLAVVILDSGVRRDLAVSAYNDRHAACRRVVEVIRSKHPDVTALRDVDLEMLESSRPALRPDDYQRARHVIEENPRPDALSAALAAGDSGRGRSDDDGLPCQFEGLVRGLDTGAERIGRCRSFDPRLLWRPPHWSRVWGMRGCDRGCGRGRLPDRGGDRTSTRNNATAS